MKKICIVTGTRAEYGLLYGLISGVHNDPELELQLLVTGMHLSPEFGLTVQQIEADGFPVTRKIEMLLSSDTATGISKSMGLAQISFAEAFEQLHPEIVVLLGDRTETLAVATAALIAGIPIAHIHGGELTEGAYDDAIRHAITKMSHMHFTATEVYRQRVIQLGEQPDSVFNVGAPGLDNIRQMQLLSREEIEKVLGRKLMKHNVLITFHPVTLENRSAGEQFTELLSAVDELDDTLLLFTHPNSDKDGRIIIRLLEKYVEEHSERALSFSSLGHLRYLSAIQYMDAVVGNSSSGIIEVPAFGVPTVNIGDRQKGRLTGPTIFNCEPTKQAISEALEKAFRMDRNIPYENPYGDGKATEQIVRKLKEIQHISLKKTFYNLPGTEA